LPDFLAVLSHRLYDDGFFADVPNQVIINEYLAGQGIAAHIDCVPCFGPTISSLSLGSDCVMQFTHGKDRCDFTLPARSLLILKDAARYEWQHAIPARQTDRINGIRQPRRRRVSLTFRTMIVA
jgi:alkylated DNA repair dioxygenase AlkB